MKQSRLEVGIRYVILGTNMRGKRHIMLKAKGCMRPSGSEASECPIYREYDGVSGKFKLFTHKTRHGHTAMRGGEAYIRKDI